MTAATPSTFIGTGVNQKKPNICCRHFDTVCRPTVCTAFVLLHLYLEAFTVEIIMLKNNGDCQQTTDGSMTQRQRYTSLLNGFYVWYQL